MDIERLRRVRALAGTLLGIRRDRHSRHVGEQITCELDALLAEHDVMTTAEACERLGLTPVAVRKHVQRKRLVARREGRTLRITRESVERFAVDRRPRKKSQK